MNINKTTLAGRLTRDPEIRYTTSGVAICDIGIAVNFFKGKGDERTEHVDFFNLTLWNKTAETAAKYLSKGRQAYFECRLNVDSWEDKETGKKRTALKITADTFQFVGDKPKGEQSNSTGPDPGAAYRKADGQKSNPAPVPAGDDDIPF